MGRYKFMRNTAAQSMLASFQPGHDMSKEIHKILSMPQYQFKNRRMMEMVGREIRKEGLKMLARSNVSPPEQDEGLLSNCKKNLLEMR